MNSVNLSEFEKFDLSLSQLQILHDQLIYPDSPHFNVGGIGNIEGELNLDRYRSAIRLLATKHKVLLAQYVRATPKWLAIPDDELLDIVDISHRSDTEAGCKEICDAMFSTPFSLISGKKLWEMKLIKIAPNHHLMVAKFHHIIMDGFSVALAFRELGAAYRELSQGEDVVNDKEWARGVSPDYQQFVLDSQQYRESAVWQKDADYWKEAIHQKQDCVFNERHRLLKKKWQTEGVSFSEAIHYFETISPEKYTQLEQFCKLHKASIYHLYALAITVYFAGISGVDELVIGVPVLNRAGKKYKTTLGMFAHLVPLKVQLDPKMSAVALMQSINKGLRECYRHARFPLGEIIKQIPVESDYATNVFDIILSYELHDFSVDFGDASLRRIQRRFSSVARYPFTFCICEFHKDDPREIAIEANNAIFTEGDIAKISKRIQHIVSQVISTPDIAVSSLPLVTQQEAFDLAQDKHDNANRSNITKTVYDDFLTQVTKNPNNIALKSVTNRMSYGALHQAVLRTSSNLMNMGVNPGDVVAIMMPGQPDVVICILAIMKLRAVYVLLDPGTSVANNNTLLQECSACLVVMDECTDVSQAPLLNCPSVSTGQLKQAAEDAICHEQLDSVAPSPQDTAYILFTSGSTGKPKGVVIKHAALWARMSWLRKEFDYSSDDVFLQSIALTFDPAQIEIFLPLVSGACCALTPNEPTAPADYLPLINQFSVTSVIFVPTTLKYFLRHIDNLERSTLRVAISGGEQLYQADAERFMSSTGAELYNLYGPTEACIFATYFKCSRSLSTNHVPIGSAVGNTRLYVLDHHKRLLPKGSYGELYIGGEGVAAGYLDKRLSENAFFPDAFVNHSTMYKTGDIVYWDAQNNLSFVARTDAQIKHRGVRIEPGDIEHQLIQTGLFKNVAVQLHKGRLCAWLEVIESKHVEAQLADKIFDVLVERIPRKLIPEKLYIIEHIPQTTSGKVDYSKLLFVACQELSISQSTGPVDSEIVNWLSAIWTRIIGIEPSGTDQSFVDAGGDSVAALNMLVEIEREFGLKFPLTFLIKHSTINSIAKAITSRSATVSQNISGHHNGKCIYFVVAGHGDAFRVKRLAIALGSTAHVLLLQPDISNNDDSELDIYQIAREYVRDISRHHNNEGFFIAGYSIGGTIALETTRLAIQNDLPVEKLLLIDSIYPNWLLRKTSIWLVLRKLLLLLRLHDENPKGSNDYNWLKDEVLNLQICSLKGYVPGQLNIDAVLLISDSMYRWKRLFMKNWSAAFLGHLHEARVTGNHTSIWSAENMPGLVDKIKQYLIK